MKKTVLYFFHGFFQRNNTRLIVDGESEENGIDIFTVTDIKVATETETQYFSFQIVASSDTRWGGLSGKVFDGFSGHADDIYSFRVHKNKMSFSRKDHWHEKEWTDYRFRKNQNGIWIGNYKGAKSGANIAYGWLTVVNKSLFDIPLAEVQL